MILDKVSCDSPSRRTVCVHAHVHVCMHVCVRAFVRACMRVYNETYDLFIQLLKLVNYLYVIIVSFKQLLSFSCSGL